MVSAPSGGVVISGGHLLKTLAGSLEFRTINVVTAISDDSHILL